MPLSRHSFRFRVVATFLVVSSLVSSIDSISADEQSAGFAQGTKLLRQSRTQTNPEIRERQIKRAVSILTTFVEENPSDPNTGIAHRQLGAYFLGKGKIALWSISADSDDRQRELKRPRRFMESARTHFEQALPRQRAAHEQFPKFIDRELDKQRFDARRKAEVRYIGSQMDLALSKYWNARTFDPSTAKRIELLKLAEVDFESIHQRYRTQVGGLYARMLHGQCRAELGDHRAALGIYNELLGHRGTTPTLVRLTDQVLERRLQILNSAARKDYQLVIQESEAWLGTAGDRQGTSSDLGMRWELAVAQEQLALKKETVAEVRVELLQKALDNFKAVEKRSTRHRPNARKRIAAIREQLGQSN